MSKTRPKIEPTVLRYASMAGLPPVDEIVRLAETFEWLQTEVAVRETFVVDGLNKDPERDARKRLAHDLTERLSDHAVGEGEGVRYETGSMNAAFQRGAGYVLKGTACINAKRSPARQVVKTHLPLFLQAATQYEALVNPLMERLAQQLGVDISTFSADAGWHRHEQTGRLKARPNEPETDAWNYFFHGVDCGFGNEATSEHAEARLGFGAECGDNFGVLEPGFFTGFLRNGAAFAALTEAELSWQEMQHAFQTMEHMGFLRLVHSVLGSEGWVLTDLGRQSGQRANETITENETTNG